VNSHYDAVNEVWIAEHDIYPITVKGPTREGCEERVRDLTLRYETIRTNAEE
jgi:hypothetical protein